MGRVDQCGRVEGLYSVGPRLVSGEQRVDESLVGNMIVEKGKVKHS